MNLPFWYPLYWYRLASVRISSNRRTSNDNQRSTHHHLFLRALQEGTFNLLVDGTFKRTIEDAWRSTTMNVLFITPVPQYFLTSQAYLWCSKLSKMIISNLVVVPTIGTSDDQCTILNEGLSLQLLALLRMGLQRLLEGSLIRNGIIDNCHRGPLGPFFILQKVPTLAKQKSGTLEYGTPLARHSSQKWGETWHEQFSSFGNHYRTHSQVL